MSVYICLILSSDGRVMRAEGIHALDEAGAILNGRALSRQVAGAEAYELWQHGRMIGGRYRAGDTAVR